MNKVALFASTPLAFSSIEFLVQRQILGVVVLTHKMTQDSYHLEQFLNFHKVPYFRYSNVEINQNFSHFEQAGCDLAVVNTFSRLPDAIIDFFKGEIYNIHPSLLPAYRGRCPLFWQLKNQEKESALTLHRLISDIDAGY